MTRAKNLAATHKWTLGYISVVTTVGALVSILDAFGKL